LDAGGRKKKLPDSTDPHFRAERNALADFFGRARQVEPPRPQNPQPAHGAQPINNISDPLNALLEAGDELNTDDAEQILAENIEPMAQLPNQPVALQERPVAVDPDNADDDVVEPNPKRQAKNRKRLIEKWRRHADYHVFEIDQSSDHYRCTACRKAGSSCALANWKPINWKKATDKFKQHLGLTKKGKLRGSEHKKSVQILENQQLVEENKEHNRTHLIGGYKMMFV